MNINNFKMDNLRKLREKRNMTQTRLSVELEVSQEIISHYEIGGSKPNVDNLLKIADFFHCSTDYLLNRTDNPTMIKYIDKNNIETTDIIYKYNTLSNEDKKHFNCFLDYLCNRNNSLSSKQ